MIYCQSSPEIPSVFVQICVENDNRTAAVGHFYDRTLVLIANCRSAKSTDEPKAMRLYRDYFTILGRNQSKCTAAYDSAAAIDLDNSTAR